MSGTSARESYRSGKRTRPSDSQANRMAPPVLFRLPSVAVPAPDSHPIASSMNAAAVSMPMPMSSPVAKTGGMSANMTAEAVAATATAPPTVSVTTQPSAPAQSAAATISADKASGQRLLNMMIIVLLLAALAIITWISMNRPATAPSMADQDVGNNAALDTLGELKVPDVTTGALAEAPKVQTDSNDDASKLLDANTATTSDLSLISLPESKPESNVDTKTKAAETPKPDDSKSLLVGLDTTGIDATQTESTPSGSSSTPTAQIQLRTPVPMANATATALVDAGRNTNQLDNAASDPANTPSFDTVSTPSQPVKIFPASTDPTQTGASPSSAVNKSNNTESKSGGSPDLWDGVKRTAPEGLQLSGKSTTVNSQTQVTVSQPLSSELTMPGTQVAAQTQTTTAAPNQLATQSPAQPEAGVTVGAGAKEPYSLRTDARSSPRTELHNSRTDLDTIMLARVAASGAAKSAVSGNANAVNSTVTSTPSAPINKYAGALNASTDGQNLYQKPNAVPTMGQNPGPLNSYAQTQVPPGATNNSPSSYVPPTTQMPNAVPNAYSQSTAQMQMASGPNSLPATTTGYTAQQRPTSNGYIQPTVNPNNGFTPAGYPNFQPAAQPPAYAPANTPANYAQPGYGLPGAPSSYTQPGSYGPASGSGYPTGTYPTPSSGMQNMPRMQNSAPGTPSMTPAGYQGGYQGAASYPTKSPYPGGVVPTGMLGPSGPATAPTGDFAPRPVMGQYGVGTSMPYGTP